MFIELRKAVKKYGEGDALVYALNSAELSLNQGEISVILGPSGSGKSTMMNMLGGLDSLDSGELIVNDKKVTGLDQKALTEYRREEIGFVFQYYNLIPDLTVAENIEVVSDISKNPLNIDEVLEALEMLPYRTRFPKELSGGQQQRVAIARALIKNPKLLLCDELTGALDSKSSKEVLKFVEKVNKLYGTTILIITHNEAIKAMADRIIRIKDGKVVENILNDSKITAEELDI
ncbi:MAG TPA: ABC transporter ATP-binding protein [Mobilitalea sp.]|nr:ABC transporter ATP-binding protein [Mobilitalea sp.]